MARVEASELRESILTVLREAATGRGSDRGFLTGYQILHRLKSDLQERLREAYGDAGRGAGNPYGAATRVSSVAAELANQGEHGVEQAYLDTRGLQFDVGQGDHVDAAYGLCALFRVR